MNYKQGIKYTTMGDYELVQVLFCLVLMQGLVERKLIQRGGRKTKK